MSRPRVIVLYEDKLGDDLRYPPHLFVNRCVFDVRGSTSGLAGLPMKGNQGILRALKRYLDAGSLLVAVFDSDRMASAVTLPKTASLEQIRASVFAKAGVEPTERCRIMPLVKNLETLITNLADCGSAVAGEALTHRAKPKPTDRDIVFKEVVTDRKLRDCVQEKNPSFAAIVRAVAELLAQP